MASSSRSKRTCGTQTVRVGGGGASFFGRPRFLRFSTRSSALAETTADRHFSHFRNGVTAASASASQAKSLANTPLRAFSNALRSRSSRPSRLASSFAASRSERTTRPRRVS